MRRNNGIPAMLATMMFGAGVMYYFDGTSGRSRRKLLSDKAVHLFHQFEHFLEMTAKDSRNRARGVFWRARARLTQDYIADNDVLVDRVRSRLGRVVSHPHSIHVQAKDGAVRLSGMILKRELASLLAVVETTRGVKTVENNLEPHEAPGNISALQGGRPRPGIRPEPLQSNWAPATRTIATLLGARLFVSGVSRINGFWGKALVMGGAALIVRAITNVEAKRMIGIADGRRPIQIHKTINVSAPVEYVFEFWSHLDNLQQVMPDIIEIKPIAKDVYQWAVEGPAGMLVRWGAEVTHFVQNELIAWRSIRGSIVENSGQVRFMRNADGSTRIDLNLAYVPPVGVLGHAVAKLFGADPQSKMDANLLRVKSLFEIGRVEGQMLERGRIVDVKPTDLH